MQLKVYVYSAFKVGVGHLSNKNFEISDSRVYLCPASIGGDWDWLRRGFSGEAQDGQKSPAHKCTRWPNLFAKMRTRQVGPVGEFVSQAVRDSNVELQAVLLQVRVALP